MKELSDLQADLKISDTDFTDYTALYFINAAAFMKWKLIRGHPCNPCLKRKIPIL